MDEEAQKRNTDCVYFLASPLTCKKGINCEFRHSKAARFHPRDCRYWLAGNCLNANCPFRHPPLDGRPASVSASAPAPSKAASTPSISATSLSIPTNKSRAPCYFFSQGYCSKGDRCAFLHGSSVSTMTSAQAVVAQKPPKAPTCKGVETNDKPTSVVETILVETNGPTIKEHGSQDGKPGAGMAPAHLLPSIVFTRAQETSCINSEAARARNSESSLSSKHQSTSSIVEHTWQQRQGRDEHEFAEARKQQSFTDEERTQNGTWRNGPPVKEASDESDNSIYGEDLPHLIARAHFPKRSYSCDDTNEFGLYAPSSSEQDSYECFDMLHECDNQHRGRHESPPFYARRNLRRIKGDLRDHLVKRRNFQDQVSDINGYSDGCQDMDDYANADERGWDDWARSRSDRDVYRRRLGGADRGRVHSPHYGVVLNVREDNVDPISSGSSPRRFSVNDCQRSKYANSEASSYGSRRARRYVTLEVSDLGAQHRLAQPGLESEIYAEDCLQTWGADTLRSEIHSSSYSSVVERPFIKSRVLPASSSDDVDLIGSISNDFEGPKPSSILLQQSRKVKEGSGETFMEQVGFDREECAKDRRSSLHRFCSEKANIAGRKRKQGDSFGSCVAPRRIA